MRRWLLVLALALLGLYASAGWLFDLVDRIANRSPSSYPAVSAHALALHDSLWIADFHNDALLWRRNLLERRTRGHVDLPRLRDGGIELAVFSATTRYHIASTHRRSLAVGDVITLAAVGSRWPRAAWFDPFWRALILATKLRGAEAASNDQLRIVRSRADLEDVVRRQAAGDTLVGAVLLLEGMHAVDGRLENIDALFNAGYRVFGIAHFFDNDVGGSAHGWRKGGLTPLGRRAVARIDSLGGIIDLAHTSPAAIEDVLALTSRPVVVSHTGIVSACAGPRNISDDVVRRIAARGGLIAIGFWKRAVCGNDARAIARSIRRAIDVAGVDHVALGSDFDGSVRVPFDAAHMAVLTQALLDEGLTSAQIRAVMGENQRRFLLEMLPAGS
jgi:membrane dipeptidase